MRVPIKGLGDVGYIADQDSYELAPNAITELQNFRMLNGWAERVKGYRQMGDDLTNVAYDVFQFATTDTKYLIYCGLGTLVADDGTTRTDVTGPTMTTNAGNKWTGGSFSGFMLLNNQADVPMSWTGSTSADFATLTGWTSTHRCKFIVPFKYHLVTGNITEGTTNYPHRVRWSAAATPGSLPSSWDYTDDTIDAGQRDVLGEGSLLDALPLGDSLILYKDYSMVVMEYLPGNTDVFSTRLLSDPVGVMTTGCVCNVPGLGHVLLTKGDFGYHAGNGFTSAIDGKNREWLFSNIDENYYDRSFVVHNPQRSEVWVCFPERGYSVCTKALTWNYRSNTFGKRDLDNILGGCSGVFTYAVDTFDSDSVTFESESVLTFNSGNEATATNDTRVFMVSDASEAFIMDSGDEADGSTFTAYIERTGLNFLDGRMQHLKRIWLNIDGDTGTQVSVYFGASNDAKTAPTYASAVTFTIGTSQKVDSWAHGRFLAFKLSATGSAFWRVRSITLEIEDGGEF